MSNEFKNSNKLSLFFKATVFATCLFFCGFIISVFFEIDSAVSFFSINPFMLLIPFAGCFLFAIVIYRFFLQFKINKKLNLIYNNQDEFLSFLKSIGFNNWSYSFQEQFLITLCKKNLINKPHFFETINNKYEEYINHEKNEQTKLQVQTIFKNLKNIPEQQENSITFFK